MRILLDKDSEGRYVLNSTGYAALQTVITLERQGWQKRSFYLNLIIFALFNIWAYLNSPSVFLFVLVSSSIWIIFYSYWTIIHRKAFEIKRKKDLVFTTENCKSEN